MSGAHKVEREVGDAPGRAVAAQIVAQQHRQHRHPGHKGAPLEPQDAAPVAACSFWGHHEHGEPAVPCPAAQQGPVPRPLLLAGGAQIQCADFYADQACSNWHRVLEVAKLLSLRPRQALPRPAPLSDCL